MRYTLITQVALISVSLVIMFTFIKPMYAEIETIQDTLFQYKDAVSKASQFNARLRELIAIRDSFSSTDIAILDNFIPTQIDALAVMKDLETIFSQKEIELTSLTSAEAAAPLTAVTFEDNMGFEGDPGLEGELMYEEEVDTTQQQEFEAKFTGTYEDLKEVLFATESSSMLLEVSELTFAAVEEEGEEVQAPTGEYDFTISFRVYGLTSSQ